MGKKFKNTLCKKRCCVVKGADTYDWWYSNPREETTLFHVPHSPTLVPATATASISAYGSSVFSHVFTPFRWLGLRCFGEEE